MAMRRIGQIFVDLGFIDDDQLEMLLEEQHQRPYELLGDVAQSLGLDGTEVWELNAFLETAERAMKRRDVPLSEKARRQLVRAWQYAVENAA